MRRLLSHAEVMDGGDRMVKFWCCLVMVLPCRAGYSAGIAEVVEQRLVAVELCCRLVMWCAVEEGVVVVMGCIVQLG